MGENINIGLTTHPINDGKKCTKRALGQADYRPKGFNLELSTKSTEEANHIITEVMNGKTGRKVNGEKIRLTNTMAR